MSNNTKPRDVAALYTQYQNLINHIFQQERSRFVYNNGDNKYVDEVRLDDLRGYIVSEFVKLVKEYDVDSPVDFPFYIKEKLTLRTRHSYLKKLFKDWDREALGTSEEQVQDLYESSQDMKAFKDSYRLSPLLDGLAQGKEEEAILTLLMNGTKTSEIIKALQPYTEKTKDELELDITRLKTRATARARELNLAPEANKKGTNRDHLIARSHNK